MNIVPIAFAFDNNLVLPACVCISSLLKNAHIDTFYDIFILHSSKTDLENNDYLKKTAEYYSNCRIQFREVGDCFDGAFEIRGITVPAYFRLLIPELIPEYDKIIYSDADIIFRMDLWNLYQLDLDNNYLAATRDLCLNLSEDGKKYIDSMPELELGNYLQSGFIMLNSRLIRENHLMNEFKRLAKFKYKYQDQDILNIACKNRVCFIPLHYNMTDLSFYYVLNHSSMLLDKYSQQDLDYAVECGNIHYNGHKPWKKYSVNFDIWWEYYRMSPVYDRNFYFDFFFKKVTVLDRLTLWKRIKILCRYFYARPQY